MVRIGLLALLAALLAAGCGEKKTAEAASDRFYTVTQGDFAVIFRLDGELASIRVHRISFDIDRGHGDLKFKKVLPDRSVVKAGDVVFSISEEWFANEEIRLETEVENAEQDHALAVHDLASLHTDAVSNLKVAADKLRTSRDDLRKYEDEDAPNRKKELAQSVTDSSVALDTAREALFQAQLELLSAYSEGDEKVAEARRKITEAEGAVTKAEGALAKSVDAMRVFKRYELRQRLDQLREAALQARLGVEKTMVAGDVAIQKKKLQILNAGERLRKRRGELEKIREDMKKLELKAPVGGTLFHEHNWRYEDGLQVGSPVNTGATIATLPDLSQFSVSVNVPEEFRSYIQTGISAYIRARAVPDLVLRGEITEIAAASTPLERWDRESPRVYATKISTDSTDGRLTPGMGVQVELQIGTVKDACFVPIEAVYNREGATYCKVRAGTEAVERAVKTGRTSLDFIEITEGLAPGDIVYLDHTT